MTDSNQTSNRSSVSLGLSFNNETDVTEPMLTFDNYDTSPGFLQKDLLNLDYDKPDYENFNPSSTPNYQYHQSFQTNAFLTANYYNLPEFMESSYDNIMNNNANNNSHYLYDTLIEDLNIPVEFQVEHYEYDDLEPFKHEKWLMKPFDPEEVSKSIQRMVNLEFELEDSYIKKNCSNQNKIKKKRKLSPSGTSNWQPISLYRAFTNIKSPLLLLDKTDYEELIVESCFGKINMREKRAWSRGPNKK